MRSPEGIVVKKMQVLDMQKFNIVKVVASPFSADRFIITKIRAEGMKN